MAGPARAFALLLTLGCGVVIGRMTVARGGVRPGAAVDTHTLAARAARGSYYFDHLHEGGHATADALPMFVGARAPDRVPANCKDVIRARLDPVAYWRAVGTPELATLLPAWKSLVADQRFLHVFVMHYPREDLPGRCVTLHVTFSTVRDPAFHVRRPPAERRGLLFSIRKTYRLGDGAPRLIEAAAEAHACEPGRSLVPTGRTLRDELGPVADDGAAMSHYTELGGGSRTGYAWTESGACAYSIDGSDVTRRSLTPDELRALFRFAGGS